MINGRIAYSTTALRGFELGERVPRRAQSREADVLLTKLGGARTNATSKSHSRALVAAAAGEAQSLKLGIDVEWIAPHRPFEAIMLSLVPSLTCALDHKSFYRGWTFLEAYYKAFQIFPGTVDVEQISMSEMGHVPLQISDGAWVWRHSVLDAFELSIVWKSSELCTIEHLPVEAVD